MLISICILLVFLIVLEIIRLKLTIDVGKKTDLANQYWECQRQRWNELCEEAIEIAKELKSDDTTNE